MKSQMRHWKKSDCKNEQKKLCAWLLSSSIPFPFISIFMIILILYFKSITKFNLAFYFLFSSFAIYCLLFHLLNSIIIIVYTLTAPFIVE